MTQQPPDDRPVSETGDARPASEPTPPDESGSPLPQPTAADEQRLEDFFAGSEADGSPDAIENAAAADTGVATDDALQSTFSQDSDSTVQTSDAGLDFSRPVGAGMTSTRAPARGDRTFLWLVFLATYAATTTAALVYLTMRLRNSGGAGLESLPDVPPLKPGEFRHYRTSAVLPAGHRLALGDSVRFGNIVVEPLRVTSGPIEFSHFRDPQSVRPPSSPVLKLWVRLTNASKTQTIAPLDGDLLMSRRLSQDGDLLTNNFVCRAEDQARGESLVFLFDRPAISEWNLRDVALDRPLAPGESIETSIPSAEEGWDELDGQLVWRLHLRKGYSRSGNGVTTLIEVAFSDNDVQSDDVEEESSPQPAA
ncbi:MAG: hypothetical protein KF774_07920 [Planctomyces sp.]|nr:hypothetical protein [Planctomyces sp.]